MPRKVAREVHETMSWSQFCGLLEIDPARLVDVRVNRVSRTVWVVLEPEQTDADKRHVPSIDEYQIRRG
jgi:hypothetical protein